MIFTRHRYLPDDGDGFVSVCGGGADDVDDCGGIDAIDWFDTLLLLTLWCSFDCFCNFYITNYYIDNKCVNCLNNWYFLLTFL